MLSVLSIAPMHLKHHWGYRTFASVENSTKVDQKETQSKRPRLDKLISEIDISSREIHATPESLAENKELLSQKIKEYKDKFLKTESDPEKLKNHRSKLNEVVTELISVEKQLTDLTSKNLISDEEANSINLVTESIKNETEDLLVDLEVNENLLAKMDDAKKKEDENQNIKKENEELKKEIARNIPSGATITEKSDEKSDEKDDDKDDKKEKKITQENNKSSKKKNKKSKKDESDKVCEHDKEQILSQKSQELIQSQNMIMQQMLSMNQMMMTMFQQYQIFQMQQQFQNQGPVNQQAYQYTPQSVGNWVYYQNGFKPGSMFPDQFGQYTPQYTPMVPQNQPLPGYNNWGPAPQFSFNPDPMMTPMPLNPGQFGNPSALGYNMTPSAGPTPPFMMQSPGQPTFI